MMVIILQNGDNWLAVNALTHYAFESFEMNESTYQVTLSMVSLQVGIKPDPTRC
jgi:hypothetical protein